MFHSTEPEFKVYDPTIEDLIKMYVDMGRTSAGSIWRELQIKHKKAVSYKQVYHRMLFETTVDKIKKRMEYWGKWRLCQNCGRSRHTYHALDCGHGVCSKCFRIHKCGEMK